MATALVAFRLGFGLASWVAPRHAWRPVGVDPSRNPDAPLVARLFATRELMIGAGLALGADATHRRRWLELGVLVDTADAVAVWLAHRRQVLGTAYALLDGGGALLAVAMGVAALRDDG